MTGKVSATFLPQIYGPISPIDMSLSSIARIVLTIQKANDTGTNMPFTFAIGIAVVLGALALTARLALNKLAPPGASP